ncbi:hypothetical protein [Ammoniphilus resinae]|uniref:Uncharacterized protein n=1 Tax=Ammoniphilus resinae TaxID=861532 RepID=A0ABS4GSW3_9BACL|nr:hypothetical protein [Ammoniphilus resinae]MBP1932935.1 hypothetical protein [Ammoniphilus resinae]
MENADRLIDGGTTHVFSIHVGQTFRPYSWKASADMDFRSECLYCDSEVLKGYIVEDEFGNVGRIATCPDCERVNAKY